MYFLMVCTHAEGADVPARRDALRPEHRAWVASGGEGRAKVLTGSALWDEAGAGIGNFGILEAARPEDARAFAEGDPFFTGGLVTGYTLTRLADGFRAERIEPLTT
ncbi:YciI family protein [Roseivivax sp.]